MRTCLLLCLLLLSEFSAWSQTDFFITANVNLYAPEGTDAKGMYPIVGYDKEADPKFLLGGYGIGFAGEKNISDKFKYKGELTLSRHVYWEAASLVGSSNTPLGEYAYGTIDYTAHLIPSVHYSLAKNLYIGTGIGASVLLTSLSRVPNVNPDDDTRKYVRNGYYRTVTPMIPIEFSYRSERKLYSIRVEQSLASRYKKSLSHLGKEHFAIVSFSVGFKVGK
jgi:hypothetical protein